MTEAGDRAPDMIWLLMAMMLPLMALFARRIPLGQALKMLLVWTFIFGAGFAVFQLVEPRLIAWKQSQRGGEIVAPSARSDNGTTQSGRIARIPMAPDGHFWTEAMVNGQPVRLLIDSGASTTAISASLADRLGIQINTMMPPVEITTANGVVEARRATLPNLRVGVIEARDLPVVVSPAFGDTSVVGMNFLSKLRSWRVEGGTMILEAP
jgi:aspartyl protease family protein